MPTLTELSQERAGLVAKMRGIIDSAKETEGKLSAEQEQEYNRIEADVDALGAKIDAEQKSIDRLAKLSGLEQSGKESRGRITAPSIINPNAGSDGADALKVKSFRRFLSYGAKGQSAEALSLQQDIDASGGNLVAPEMFMAEVIKFVNNLVHMRGLARTISLIGAESVGIPSLDADPADPTWTAELSTGSEDSTMGFGKRRLTPHPLAQRIKVSTDLLRNSAVPVDSLVAERLAYKSSVVQENGFLNGNGSSQPLGVFFASNNGISTGRDMATANTATAITADGLINCKFNLKSQYMNSPALRWMFHRDAVRNIRKLKDGNGQYLWTAGLAGAPDTILEVPYLMSEYAPNTFTSGLYVGIIGDFSYYWIAENLSVTVQRLDELYAETNQIGFIIRSKLDGMPVLEEAFSRVKLG